MDVKILRGRAQSSTLDPVFCIITDPPLLFGIQQELYPQEERTYYIFNGAFPNFTNIMYNKFSTFPSSKNPMIVGISR